MPGQGPSKSLPTCSVNWGDVRAQWNPPLSLAAIGATVTSGASKRATMNAAITKRWESLLVTFGTPGCVQGASDWRALDRIIASHEARDCYVAILTLMPRSCPGPSGPLPGPLFKNAAQALPVSRRVHSGGEQNCLISTRLVNGSRHLRLGKFRFNRLLHRVEIMPFGNLGAVDQDRRRAVDPLGLSFRNGRLYTSFLLATVETLIERRRVQS